MIAIDVGNTKTAIALFREGTLASRWQLGTDPRRSADEYKRLLTTFLTEVNESLRSAGPAILSSVVPTVTDELSLIRDELDLHIVTHKTPRSFELAIPRPESLGADRIADLEGAFRKYGAPAIVVDAGTATTVNALNRRKEFIGGAIAPGYGISLEALFERAAKISETRVSLPRRAIGPTTEEGIESGAYFGHAALIQGLVERVRQELEEPSAVVICSGGAIDTLASLLPTSFTIDRNLTLEGLAFLHDNLRRGKSNG